MHQWEIYYVFMCLPSFIYNFRNMFSLFNSLLANKGAWCVTFQNNQKKIEKVWFLRFYKRFFNYFLTE